MIIMVLHLEDHPSLRPLPNPLDRSLPDPGVALGPCRRMRQPIARWGDSPETGEVKGRHGGVLKTWHFNGMVSM